MTQAFLKNYDTKNYFECKNYFLMHKTTAAATTKEIYQNFGSANLTILKVLISNNEGLFFFILFYSPKNSCFRTIALYPLISNIFFPFLIN